MKSKLNLVLVVVFLFVSVWTFNAFSNATNMSMVSVTSNKGQLIFFDKSKSEVYVYGQTNGKFLYSWRVDTLGNDLLETKSDSIWQRNRGQ